MVFHRFLEGERGHRCRLTITVNGEKVRPWNPFARSRTAVRTAAAVVRGRRRRPSRPRHAQPYVLPPREPSHPAEFERLSGPLKWNRQQGLYIYRADRLIQHGGWCGIRAADEHTKFARASLDFQTDLDTCSRSTSPRCVCAPPRSERCSSGPIHELCHRADAVYRGSRQRSRASLGNPEPCTRGQRDLTAAGDRHAETSALLLMAAASMPASTTALTGSWRGCGSAPGRLAVASLGW